MFYRSLYTQPRTAIWTPSRHFKFTFKFLITTFCGKSVGTVDNHGNTEITETVIFVKCHECRDFAKVPCFWRVFCQIATVLRFQQNISFLIIII